MLTFLKDLKSTKGLLPPGSSESFQFRTQKEPLAVLKPRLLAAATWGSPSKSSSGPQLGWDWTNQKREGVLRCHSRWPGLLHWKHASPTLLFVSMQTENWNVMMSQKAGTLMILRVKRTYCIIPDGKSLHRLSLGNVVWVFCTNQRSRWPRGHD